MYINTDELQEAISIDEKKIEMTAETILQDYFEEMPDFTLIFFDADKIRELNRQYRQVDSVTDVLSFEAEGEIDPETGKEYLGDIVICPEQAAKQAEQSGHSLENEILLLEIHGLLHLLGYDHEASPLEQRQMREKEESVLEKLGFSRDTSYIVPEEQE